MANINLLSSNKQTDSAWASALPSSIKTTAGAAKEAELAGSAKSNMGQKDFLTLFTTQLKNQDPLDPVKNEAFVAQLAQVSQLEATTNMSTTLNDFVASMGSNQITAGANLLGKKVSVADAPAQLIGGQPIQGIVSLPNGAQGIQVQVFDEKGILVNTQILGAQVAGDMPWAWNGANDAGNVLPDGNYRFAAKAVVEGKTTTPSVSTMATVTGISQQADKSIVLQVQGGKSIKLSDVKRIDG